MMASGIVCQVFEGIGDRINGMASALATGRSVELHWAVNRHCPVRFEDVFADACGMSVVNDHTEAYAYSHTSERLCWFYPLNVDRMAFRVFRQRILAAYRQLLEAMRGEQIREPPKHALGLSFSLRGGAADGMEPFWTFAGQALERLAPATVVITADEANAKAELIRRVESLGIVSLSSDYCVAQDVVRSPSDIRGVCEDLRLLSECSLGVICNCAHSTLPDSLRGLGVKVYCASSDDDHRHGGRDHLYVKTSAAQLAAGNGQEAAGDAKVVPSRVDPPKLSLCMIVRDSSATLDACLESAAPWFDEIVIVDTGSVDQTPEIASSYGARVFEFPWCDDFSAARNESLRRARGEWLFWMDSDDTIRPENGRKLRELVHQSNPETTLGFVVQVHCPGASQRDVTVVDHVKLIRNRPDLRFEGRIHEQLLSSIRAAGGVVNWTDIFVVHSGADRTPAGRRKKIDRDIRLLQLELKERPDHPFVLFNIGMTLADAGDHDQAVAFLSRGILVAHPQESHVRKAYALLASSFGELGRLDAAYETCRKGRELFPQDVELAFRQGIVAHQLGRLDEAIDAYKAAIAPPSDRQFSSVDPAIGGFKARHNMALVYQQMRSFAAAEEQWRAAVDEAPGFAAAWRGLGETLLAQENLAEAVQLVERLKSDQLLCVEGLLLEAECAGRSQSRSHQLQMLLEARHRFPQDEVVFEAYCRFVFEHGTLVEAEEALHRLVHARPNDAAAQHNLGIVYFRMGHHRAAVDRFRESLRLRPDSPATRSHLEQSLASIDGAQTTLS